MPEPADGPPFNCRVGDVFRINDTGSLFIVTALDGRYAEVCDQAGRRRRRILRHTVRPSRAKHGYSLVERTDPDDE